MTPYRTCIFFLLLFFYRLAFAQQAVEFHVTDRLLPGIKVLKVKCDFHDPCAWVLAENNRIYRVNSVTKKVDDFTSRFTAFKNVTFNDIVGECADTVFIWNDKNLVIQYKKGQFKTISTAEGLPDQVNSIGIDYTRTFMADPANVLLIDTVNGFYRYNLDSEQLLSRSEKQNSQIFEAFYKKAMYSESYFANYVIDIVDYVPIYVAEDRRYFTEYTWLGGNSFSAHINSAFYLSPMIYDFYIHISNVPQKGSAFRKPDRYLLIK